MGVEFDGVATVDASRGFGGNGLAKPLTRVPLPSSPSILYLEIENWGSEKMRKKRER